MTKKKPYAKKKVICPFCQQRQENGNFRAFSINGMPMHCRQIHPGNYDDYMTHRDEYNAKFACDDDGNLIGTDPEPDVDKSDPVRIEEEVISEPEYIEPEERAPPPAAKKSNPKPMPEEPKQEEFPDDTKVRKHYRYGFSD